MKHFGIILLLISVVIVAGTGCGVKEGKLDGPIKLRSQHTILSDDDVIAMVKKYNFYDSRRNKFRSFPNKFELKEVGPNKEKIVIDRSVNLVWHQSGSDYQMNLIDAFDWLQALNNTGYGGYRTWRFPTLEEAASLLEGKRVRSRYISPLFSGLQHSIRTGDKYNPVRYWGVSFHFGRIFKVGGHEPDYMRPVATLEE